MGKRTDKEGIDKNREIGMEFVPAPPAMTAAVKDVMTKVVLPNWLKRAGPDAKPILNQYLVSFSVLTLP
jgi:hypothetical protein